MELGLRLGDSSPPFKYSEKPLDSSVSHRALEFSLGFSSINPHLVRDDLTRNQIRNHIDIDIDNDDGDNGNDDDDDDDDNDNDNDNDSPFQLDLLPRTPVFHNFSFPSTETGMAVTDGGGESPRNGVMSSSMELEFYKYGGERGCSRASDEDDQNNIIGSDNSKKKLRLSREQSAFLEESFKEHHTLYPKQKLELARRLNLRPRQVEVWFQNRRARTKLKQTEVDCEYLKKCCETLTQENRKLQKELRDLRALKTTDSLFMHSPATTLTMCPSCERIATANTATVPGTGSKEPMSKASGFPFTRPSRS